MSILNRVRARLALCCVASLAVFGALVMAPSAGAATLGSTYLALGDSLAYGFHHAQFYQELETKGFVEPATFEEGYVNDFANYYLKPFNPNLKVIDDGCPGETSETFINGATPYPTSTYCAGGATGSPFPKAFLHHSYAGSQLSDALAILKSTPNVSPITLNIGSNDVLQFLEHTCGFPATFTCSEAQVGAEYVHIQTNVSTILADLRAAAPKAQIVLVGAYNPYPTLLPAPGGDKDLAELNSLLASAAAKVPGTSFANSEPLFNPSGYLGGSESGDIPIICAFTAMCPGGKYDPASPEADIHPTKLGYQVMGLVVALDFWTH
jgi:lysophospholipase L1-like esterase